VKLRNTPVNEILFNQHRVYVKRDDLLDVAFSGNKARKFYHFLQQDLTQVNKLIGHGSAQANSLYSLSVLAQLKQCQLDYYIDHLPGYLAANPQGNYRAALANGANIIVAPPATDSVSDYIQQEVLPNEQAALFIPEGGRCLYAESGIKILAEEILDWAKAQGLANIRVVLPSGTGTTALFLQKNLPFEVQTCACVGGDSYLKQQFTQLCADESLHPTILTTSKKYHFGKLYPEFYQIWLQLKATTDIEFELLYDPQAWLCLQEQFNAQETDPRPILYIHQGGLQGNETMLPRYLRKAALAQK
jgi:1-aminocyclopropane-1-carboxylate deaminase